MDIMKCLTISTANITEETCLKLKQTALSDQLDLGVPVYQKAEYGYWIYIPEYIDDISEKIPHDLMACIEVSRQNNCQLLCLDRDGEILDTIPAYEW